MVLNARTTNNVDFIAKAKSQGYRINLFVSHIDASPFPYIARVANRVTQGNGVALAKNMTDFLEKLISMGAVHNEHD